MTEQVAENVLGTRFEPELGRRRRPALPRVGAWNSQMPLISPIGRYSMATACCVSVLMKRVATRMTSSTSPFKKRSRAMAAIARASANRGVSPYGKSATSCRRVRATNCAALRPAVMKTVERWS